MPSVICSPRLAPKGQGRESCPEPYFAWAVGGTRILTRGREDNPEIPQGPKVKVTGCGSGVSTFFCIGVIEQFFKRFLSEDRNCDAMYSSSSNHDKISHELHLTVKETGRRG